MTLLHKEVCGMAARHHEPDGLPDPVCSRGHGSGVVRSTQVPEPSTTGGVLWIGHTCAPAEGKA